MQIYGNKRMCILTKTNVTATGLVENSNMAAISLSFVTYVAAVTSCEMRSSFISIQRVLRPW